MRPLDRRGLQTKRAPLLALSAAALLGIGQSKAIAEPKAQPAGLRSESKAAQAKRISPCGRTRYVTVYDSHGLTEFGEQLDKWILGQKDTELDSYTLGGASPEWLVTTKVSIRGYHYHNCENVTRLPRSKLDQRKLRAPTVDELFPAPFGTYERQIVLITLGSNIPGSPAAQIQNIEKTVRQIKAHPGAVCIWIGPPNMRSWKPRFANEAYEALQKGIEAADDSHGKGRPPCYLIDSRKLSSYPDGGDGWHYGFFPAGIEGATHWAFGVAKEVETILKALGPPKPIAEQVLFHFDYGTRTPPYFRPFP